MRKIFVLMIVVAIFISACTPPFKSYQFSFIGPFDTVTTISGNFQKKSDFEDRAKTVEAEIKRLHELFDAYNFYDKTNIASINKNAGGSWCIVDESIAELLIFGKDVHKETNGNVNIMLGAVTNLWKTAQKMNTIPEKESLKVAAEHCGIDLLEIKLESNQYKIRITDPMARIDVGAIAKGFALEKVATLYYKKFPEDKTGMLINIGGNLRALGNSSKNKKSWRIGINFPENGRERQLFSLDVEDSNVATCGNEWRQGHVISPKTLNPAKNYYSVTVVAEGIKACWADAASTALFIMDKDEAQSFIKRLGGDFRIIYINEDGSYFEFRYSDIIK